MKTPRLPLLAACAALLFSVLAPAIRAQTPAAPATPAGKVYVMIEYFDPIRFDRMRHALASGDELILATLKSSAAEQAKFAGYAGEVIVLDEKAKAPEGATLLRLTWNDSAVTADVTQGSQNKYLGVVNRLPLSYHPDYQRMQRSIDTAGLPDARRDAALRAQVQMELFMALQYLVRHQKGPAAQN